MCCSSSFKSSRKGWDAQKQTTQMDHFLVWLRSLPCAKLTTPADWWTPGIKPHKTSAVSPRDIIVDVIKKLLSCCVWYTAHKAVTSTQPNTPPWLSCSLPSQLWKMLTHFRSFGHNWLSQGTCKAKALSLSLPGYISSTFPLKESEQNFAQSIHSLLFLLPISSNKAFLCQICWSVTDKQLQ